jgi:hypothetical protein
MRQIVRQHPRLRSLSWRATIAPMEQMHGLTDRAYRGVDDLRLMQEGLVADFDGAAWRIGDLAWAARENTHSELSLHVRLVFAGDDLAGWTWTWGRGLIDVHLTPERRDLETYDWMLAGAEATVSAMVRAGDPLSECRTEAPEDDAMLAAVLVQRGFTPGGAALQVNRRGLDDLPAAVHLPRGWSTAALETEEHVESKVECHRAAFAPSSLTVEKYRRVRRTWPYRAELDRVVLDEHGGVVATCTAWLDESNGEGLFEPVSTRPADQGRGARRSAALPTHGPAQPTCPSALSHAAACPATSRRRRRWQRWSPTTAGGHVAAASVPSRARRARMPTRARRASVPTRARRSGDRRSRG